MQVEAQALVIDSLQREGLGIEMQQFSKQLQKFDTEDKAEAWFVEQRWPSGVACPFCGTLNIAVVASRKPQPFRCREKECRKSFSVKTGTLLHSSNLPLSQWAIAFFLYATNLKGVSSMKLHRDLGHSPKLGVVHGAPDTGNVLMRWPPPARPCVRAFFCCP